MSLEMLLTKLSGGYDAKAAIKQVAETSGNRV
jgi:hypothetical protein